MTEYPYQGTMVGSNRIPKRRREKYDFLIDVFKEMNQGQVFRVVVPTFNMARAITHRWKAMKTGKVMQGITYKQPEGGVQAYVWFEEHKII